MEDKLSSDFHFRAPTTLVDKFRRLPLIERQQALNQFRNLLHVIVGSGPMNLEGFDRKGTIESIDYMMSLWSNEDICRLCCLTVIVNGIKKETNKIPNENEQ